MADVVDLSEIEAATHRASITGSTLDNLARGAPGLYRLLENLCPEEVDPKHRRLRLGNAALRERVFDPLPGSLDVLCSLGYSLQEEDGETCLILDVARHSPAVAHAEIKWLRELVDHRWRSPSWNCSTCTLLNEPGSSMCAACDGPRPTGAAPTTIPLPKLAPPSPQHTPQVAPTRVGCSNEAQQNRSAGIRRVRNEKTEERDRILAEAKADRERFAHVGTSQSAPSGSAASVVADAPPRSVAHAFTVVRVRLPDGGVTEESFGANDILSKVFLHMDSLLNSARGTVEDYSLLQAIPRRVFIREVLGNRSLAELGLVPSATLTVLRAEDRGHVESGGVQTALLTGDIDNLSYEELQELETRMGDAGKRQRRPSARTRNAQTRLHTYGDGKRPSHIAGTSSMGGVQLDLENRCAICLVEFELGASLRTLWCGHGFHQVCVDRWLAEKDECPVCRVAFES